MHINEMDIQFQLKLHSIASNALAGLQEEERMILLNSAQLELIQAVVNPSRDPLREGYAATRFRLDEIEALITSATLPLYQKNASSGYAPLPSNYLEGLEVSAKTGCDTAKLTTVTKTFRYATLTLPTAQITDEWLVTINTDAESEPIFRYTDYFTAGEDADLNYRIIPVLLRNVAYAGLTVYWERYGTIYKPGKFIFVFESDDEILGSISASLDGAPSVFNYATEVARLGYATTEATALVPCRTVDASVARQQSNPFTKSIARSPLVTYSQGEIVLYTFGKFAATELEIQYLRKPLELSLQLKQSCELGSTPGTKELICRSIIDRAVRIASASVGNPAYQVTAAESLMST